MKKCFIYEFSAGLSFYTYRLCNELAKYEDLDLTYMTEENNTRLGELNPKIHLIQTIKPYRTDLKKGSIKWFADRIKKTFFNLKKRNAFLKKNHFDIISIQWTVPIFEQFFIRKLKRKSKIILTVHDVIPPTKSFFWSTKSLKKLYTTADFLYVHSQANKNQLIDCFHIDEAKIQVGCIGTDTSFVRFSKNECRERLGLPLDKTVFLFYGSIREQKGLDDLICALRNIPDSLLFIAGAMPFGESFDKYQSLIDSNNIMTKQIIEYVPDELTDFIYQSCDIICLPYKYFFSQSGVLLQSLKYKRAILATDIPSFREIIERYKIGFIAKAQSVSSINEQALLARDFVLSKKDISNNFENALIDNSWEKCAFYFYKAI